MLHDARGIKNETTTVIPVENVEAGDTPRILPGKTTEPELGNGIDDCLSILVDKGKPEGI